MTRLFDNLACCLGVLLLLEKEYFDMLLITKPLLSKVGLLSQLLIKDYG